MGACCSGDLVPPVPINMRDDPDAEQVINAAVAKLGFFGFSRDYGIWYEKRPDSSDDQKNNIWLWFNKGNVPGGGRNAVVIDLENFKRQDESNPKKGKILYSAFFQDVPNFLVFQRFANHGFTFFSGFMKNLKQDEQDDFYINHPTHMNALSSKRQMSGFVRMVDSCVVSKWQFNNQVHFKDGNLGRGEAYFFGASPLLEVYSKGTVVTSYYEHRVPQGNNLPERIEIDKCETEFVDVIQFRLSVNNLLIAEWNVMGDSFAYGSSDINIDTPLFSAVLVGGWFTRSTFVINTKAGIPIDSALALLVAHVSLTEYSVVEIKKELKVNTPHRPPANSNMLMALDASKMIFNGITTKGSYVKKTKF